jgi:hypothetical protein
MYDFISGLPENAPSSDSPLRTIDGEFQNLTSLETGDVMGIGMEPP